MKSAKKKPAASAPGESGFSLISNDKLLVLYGAMLKCSMLADRLRAMHGKMPTGDAGNRGREAAFVGATIDLQVKDAISPSAGSAIPRFLAGVPLTTIFSSHRRTAVAPGTTLAGRLEAALDMARLNKRKRSRKVVVVFADFGRQWSLASKFLRTASQKKLAVIFITDGNRGKEDLAAKAHDCSVPGMIVDGHDVVAVYRVMSEATTHARRGNGPTFIECRPWIVEQDGRRRRASGDAIRNMEKYLSGKRLFTRKFKASVVADFARELDEAATSLPTNA